MVNVTATAQDVAARASAAAGRALSANCETWCNEYTCDSPGCAGCSRCSNRAAHPAQNLRVEYPTDTQPHQTFYAYRVQGDDDYPFTNVNAADLLGAVCYIHMECLGVSCPRKFSVTRIKRYRWPPPPCLPPPAYYLDAHRR